MAAKQLPGRSACTTACSPPCPVVRPTNPAFFLDDNPAITYTDKTTSHLLGFPRQSDPSRIAALAIERRGSTHD